MDVVEIIDSRFHRNFAKTHLSSSPNYFLIIFTEESCRDLLVWPGGNLMIRRRISNKWIRNLKTKPIKLGKTCNNVILGSYKNIETNCMYLYHDDNYYYTLDYSSKINIRILDNILDLLYRLEI